jgi:hypothetical protein
MMLSNLNRESAAGARASSFAGSLHFLLGSITAIIVCSYLLVLSIGDMALANAANSHLPLLQGLACLAFAYLLVRRNPTSAWTPLPWFTTAWAVYYGLGPLAYIYGTPETIDYMNEFSPVDELTLLRTNLLNETSLLAVIVGSSVIDRLWAQQTSRRQTSHGHDPLRVALLFLSIGLPIKFLFELPYVLELSDFVLPGSIQYLGSLSGLAIVPLSVAAARKRSGATILLAAVIVVEVLVGFVMLAKLHIIKTVILLLLGQWVVKADLRRIILVGLAISITYAVALSPFINFARIMLGRATAENVADVTAAASAYGAQGEDVLSIVLPGVQSWWTRLSYSNVQAFAMNQFDEGRPGATLEGTVYVIVPRMLFEDKPTMSPGKGFTYLIRGSEDSSTGLGFAAEAYWNGGWILAGSIGVFVGLIFSIIGRCSTYCIRREYWLGMPIIFHSVYIGLRPDDWFVPAYIGGTLQALLLSAFLLLAGSKIFRNE